MWNLFHRNNLFTCDEQTVRQQSVISTYAFELKMHFKIKFVCVFCMQKMEEGDEYDADDFEETETMVR